MAKTHQPLESEKYLMSSIRDEQAKQRKVSSLAGIKTLIIFLLWIAVGYCVIKSMPSWLPIVEAQVQEWIK